MQSHFSKAQTVATIAQAAVGPQPVEYLSGFCNLTCEQPVLLGPVERQIEFRQTRRSELDGLPPLQHHFDQIRAKEKRDLRGAVCSAG
jgi:hypothetical protein